MAFPFGGEVLLASSKPCIGFMITTLAPRDVEELPVIGSSDIVNVGEDPPASIDHSVCRHDR